VLVSVAGACSRAGKTALAETLLRAAPAGHAMAIKFTTTDDVFERCPRGTTCVVCDIDVPFRLVQEARALDEPGTDTARLRLAGASSVLWTIARRGAVEAAWQATRARLGGAGCVVMEGSSIVPVARPDLLLFVAHPFLLPERWKAQSQALVAGADMVVVNRPRDETRAPAQAVLNELRAWRDHDDIRVADVAAPLHTWAADIARRLTLPVLAPGGDAFSFPQDGTHG
jgi:hypothetical protein